MADAPEIGQHMATLNLFREADGSYFITVASASMESIVAAREAGKVPFDWLALKIVEGATNTARGVAKQEA